MTYEMVKELLNTASACKDVTIIEEFENEIEMWIDYYFTSTDNSTALLQKLENEELIDSILDTLTENADFTAWEEEGLYVHHFENFVVIVRFNEFDI